MNVYNIAVLSGVDRYLDYEPATDTIRALKRINEHNIIHVDYKKIYKEKGPKSAPNVINKMLVDEKVDIVILGLDDEYLFPIEYFSDLSNRYYTVLCAFDDANYFDKSTRYYAQAFDLVLTEGLHNVRRYELYGMNSRPYYGGYDVQTLSKFRSEKQYDVCFVGDIGGKVGRREHLRHLIENNINTKAHGWGTIGGVVSNDEMYRIYGSSRIGLNLSGVTMGSYLDKDLTINRRIKPIKGKSQEIALTGTFVLSEYSPGTNEIFDVGREIDIFHDREELLSKVKYYLENDKEREEMAARAFERAIHDYDEVTVWKGYIEVIAQELEKKKEKSIRPLYKDPIFTRAFASFHLFKSLDCVARFELKKAFDEFNIYVKSPFFDYGVFLSYVKRFLINIHWFRKMLRKLKMLLGKRNGAEV
jgi:hypothetical protein